MTIPKDAPQPLVLIPVTADDVARRRHRVQRISAIAIVAALAVAGYMYKRNVDPMKAQDAFDAGARLFKVARYNEAVISFERAIALKPDFAEAYLMRARSFVGEAEPGHALADFSRLIELRPADPTGWKERGRAYLDLGDFPAAIADASQAIAVDPKEAAAYNLRGTVYRKTGDLKRSLDDFNRAVELNPSADNYYQRGSTYQSLGNHDLAIADFNKVIEILPEMGGAFFARASSRRALGDFDAAQLDYLQGRQLDGR